METIKGIPVSPGISIADVALLRSDNLRIHRRFVAPKDVESEVRRFEQAARKASRDLEVQIADLGEELMIAAQVLQTHRDMLNDPGLHSDVISRIRDNQFTAAYASSIVLGENHDRIEQMESEYLSERSHDIRDIERQLLTRILGKRRRPRVFRENVTGGAHILTPSQTASMAKESGRLRGRCWRPYISYGYPGASAPGPGSGRSQGCLPEGCQWRHPGNRWLYRRGHRQSRQKDPGELQAQGAIFRKVLQRTAGGDQLAGGNHRWS